MLSQFKNLHIKLLSIFLASWGYLSTVQVVVLVVSLLTARHCSSSPLLPVVSLLQDMPMEGMEMMPMMTSEPMMMNMGES